MIDPNGLLAEDPVLGPVVSTHGPVTVEPADDLYRRLVVSVVRQQVSMDAASAIRERLFDRFDVTPGGILDADASALQDVGLSEAKVEYVKSTATAFDEREWDPEYFEGMSDDAVVSELTTVRGVGPWTADMVLLFGLGREDVFPVGDLGIRRGMQTLFQDEMTRGEMRAEAERWAPYRSYASEYVWQVADGEGQP